MSNLKVARSSYSFESNHMTPSISVKIWTKSSPIHRIFFTTFDTVDIYIFLCGYLMWLFWDIFLKHLVVKCTKKHPCQRDHLNSHSETYFQSLCILVNMSDTTQVVIVSMRLMSLLELVFYFVIVTKLAPYAL